MDRHGIRYTFEHRLLPQWFFEDKERFVAVLLKDKGLLFDVINEIFQKENVKNPYTPDQFDIEPARLTDELLMVKIIFPDRKKNLFAIAVICFLILLLKIRRFFVLKKATRIAMIVHLSVPGRKMGYTGIMGTVRLKTIMTLPNVWKLSWETKRSNRTLTRAGVDRLFTSSLK